jgi:hypothetical protein
MAGNEWRKGKSFTENLADDLEGFYSGVKGMVGNEPYVPPIKRNNPGKTQNTAPAQPERDIRAEAMRTGRPEDLDAAPMPVKAAVVVKPKGKPPVAAVKVKANQPEMASVPKVDDMAEVRADLLANQRADEAARAAAERKRKEADDFSKRLKSVTARPAASKTGYDSYRSLMGE